MIVKDAFKDAMNHFIDNPIMLLGLLGIITLVLLSSVSPAFKKQINNYLQYDSMTSLGSKNNKYSKPPAFTLKREGNYFAIVSTSKGSFTIDLFENDTPKNVNNFVFLANDRFYNGLDFFVVREGVVMQGGDPKGDGTGTPGYTIPDEIDAHALGLDQIIVRNAHFLRELYSEDVLKKYASLNVSDLYSTVDGYTYTPGYGTHKFGPYMVGMANWGPNTNGCQFFVTGKLFNSRLLDGRYTAIGRVISGKSVVDAIMAGSVDSHGWLKTPVEISSIKIVVK